MTGRRLTVVPLFAMALTLAVPAGAQQAAPPQGNVNDVLSMPRIDPQMQYLVENQKKPGWQVTPSGLQYRVVRRVAGNAPRPLLTDEVTVNYRGVLIDGKEFDSSYGRGRPATFPVSKVVRGWQEALPMMRVGEQWELAIPGNLGYGLRGQLDGGIPPNATLLFTIELLGIRKPDTTNLLARPGTIQ